MLRLIKFMFGRRQNSNETIVSALARGNELLVSNNTEEALAAYQEVLKLCPNNLVALQNAAFCKLELGLIEGALPLLEKALIIDSSLPDASYMLGTLHVKNGNFPAAEQHFRRAIELRHGFEFAYRDLFYGLVANSLRDDATSVIKQAIVECPENAEFRFCLGNLHFEAGQLQDAITCFRATVALAPTSVSAWLGLGNAMLTSGKPSDAETFFRRALELEDTSLHGRLGLGKAFEAMGNLNTAIDCYRYAAGQSPESPLPWLNLGMIKEKLGAFDEAIMCLRQAIERDVDLVAAWQTLGNVYFDRGEIDLAKECFLEVLRIEPKHPLLHLVSAFNGETTISAPPSYVEKLFDDYADRFDSHLVGSLEYTTPDKLIRLLDKGFLAEIASLKVMDLGCGTGLFGEALPARPELLVGIDLSAKMLEKATTREIYHRLEHGELLVTMAREENASFDLIAAADVFVYIGRLDEVVREARRLLKPDGLFLFSVESMEESACRLPDSGMGFFLAPSGRYLHTRPYLAQLSKESGFCSFASTETAIRKDKGKAIIGYLEAWKKLNSSDSEV